jgi:hypothetical protein
MGILRLDLIEAEQIGSQIRGGEDTNASGRLRPDPPRSARARERFRWP